MLSKKTIPRSLLLGLVLLLAAATMGAAAPGENEGTAGLSLQQAIDLALANNPQVELDKITLEKKKMAQEQADKQAKDIADAKDTPFGEAYYNYQGAQAQYVAPRSAQMQLTLAENKARALEDGLKMTVEKSYYDVLKAQTDLDNKKLALDRAREALRLAEAQLEAGTVPQTDVMQSKVDLAGAEADVSAAENTLALKWLILNQAMGQPLDTKWQLTDSFSFAHQDIDLEQAVTDARDKDIELIGYREGVDLAAVNFEQAKKYYTPNVYDYRKAQYDYQEAQATLRKTETATELKVREAYSNLQSLEKGYTVLEQQLEVMRENVRLANLQYEMGMITQFQLRQAEDGLKQLESKLNEMLYNYNLITAQFKYDIYLSGTTGESSTGSAAGF